MKLKLGKFGNILNSRSSGKEAYLSAKAYSLPKDQSEQIEIDFSGVDVLTPSWADEFLTPILEEYKEKVDLLPSKNASVKAALEIIGAK